MSNNTNLIIYSLEKKAMSFSCELKNGGFLLSWTQEWGGVGVGTGWLSPLGLFSRFSVLNCNLLKRCHYYKTVYGLHLRSADPVGAIMELNCSPWGALSGCSAFALSSASLRRFSTLCHLWISSPSQCLAFWGYWMMYWSSCCCWFIVTEVYRRVVANRAREWVAQDAQEGV